MTSIGTEGNPLRVAVVGSGPAGFYVAEHLLNRDDLVVDVDMFERLPTPYGLVRFGVAPDHEKIKNVTRTFDKKAASNPRFRFFGNVEVGKHATLDDLRQHYHHICFASGAQTDRRMETLEHLLNRGDLVVQRIVVKENFSRDLAEHLLEDLRRAVEYFESQPGHQAKEEGSHFHH